MLKKLGLVLFGLFFIQGIFAQDPVFGLWKSIDENTNKVTGIWKIYEKNGKLFGEMIMTLGHYPDEAAKSCKSSYKDFPKAGNVNKMPLVGTSFIYNLIKKSEGYWYKGYIINNPYACVGVYCSHKVVAVGFNTLCYDAERRGIKPSARINPANGKHYNCKIIFRKTDGKKYKVDTLEMRGEIGLGIGRSQYWHKTTQDEADELIKNNKPEGDYIKATE